MRTEQFAPTPAGSRNKQTPWLAIRAVLSANRALPERAVLLAPPLRLLVGIRAGATLMRPNSERNYRLLRLFRMRERCWWSKLETPSVRRLGALPYVIATGTTPSRGRTTVRPCTVLFCGPREDDGGVQATSVKV